MPIQLHQAVRRRIAELIAQGHYTAGQSFWSVEQLCSLCAAQREDVERALRSMQRDGVFYPGQAALRVLHPAGLVQFVAHPRTSTSLSRSARAKGNVVRSELLAQERRNSGSLPAHICLCLQLSDEDDALCVDRLRYINGLPLVRQRVCVSLAFPESDGLVAHDYGVDSLKEAYDVAGLSILRKEKVFTAVLADEELRRAFGSDGCDPMAVLHVTQLSYARDANGRKFLLEFMDAHYHKWTYTEVVE